MKRARHKIIAHACKMIGGFDAITWRMVLRPTEHIARFFSLDRTSGPTYFRVWHGFLPLYEHSEHFNLGYARYRLPEGGEEHLVVPPGTEQQAAEELVGRIIPKYLDKLAKVRTPEDFLVAAAERFADAVETRFDTYELGYALTLFMAGHVGQAREALARVAGRDGSYPPTNHRARAFLAILDRSEIDFAAAMAALEDRNAQNLFHGKLTRTA